MIDNQDKIDLIINRLNNVHGDIISYTKYADDFQDKYSLEDVLPKCNAIKLALLEELESLGGSWTPPVD